MKNRFLFVVGILIFAVFFANNIFFTKKKNISPISMTKTVTLPLEGKAEYVQKQSVFVPYWAVTSAISNIYDEVYYFGVSVTDEGINTEDVGFKNIEKFTQIAPNNSATFLVVRMLNTKINFSILENKAKQKTVIQESLAIAKDNNFDGIILDLELSSLPFDSVRTQINSFTKMYYELSSRENKKLYVVLYGDVFYRLRPFDVGIIAKNSDKILVMAYDFHKSSGTTAGPNFPFKGREHYGYDFELMIDNYLELTTPEKLTVIFGYFGYDWKVNDKGVAVSPGIPLSYNEIKQKYLINCLEKDCVIKRDTLTFENNITYIDKDSQKHSVWFEDMESVIKKKTYLEKKGIENISYWAHSYY